MLAIGLLGAILLGHAVWAISHGAINLTGMRVGAQLVKFVDSPFLFSVCVLLLALLGAAGLYAAWRELIGKGVL